MRMGKWSTGLGLIVGLSLGGCLEQEAVDLTGKSCPCEADGWTCDDATDTCVRGGGGGGTPDRDAGPGVDSGPGEDAGGVEMDAGGMEMDAGPMAQTFWFEAEAGDIEAPMQTGDDADASGGQYVTVDPATASSTDARPGTGQVSFTFTVTEEAEFRAWGRFYVTADSDDSFWVCMDDCTEDSRWNLLNAVGVNMWLWDDMHSDDPDATAPTTIWTLDPGDHTLHVYYREVGAQLDKVVITDDPDLMPSGLGE